MNRQRVATIVTILAVLGLLLGSAGGVAAKSPSFQTGAWRGTYYNNPNLAAPAAFERDDASLNFNWGGGGPGSGVGNDYFSVRWTRLLEVTPGTYRFTATSDDGVRVYVDGRLLIDQWHTHPAQIYSADIALSAGQHYVVVEYFESQGEALISLNWTALTTSTPPPQSGWVGQYYPNRDLTSSPVVTRQDAEINFDWGLGSPFPSEIGSDNFSVRWTRTISFEAATYRFHATVDDGVRLWVGSRLLIDRWYDQPATTHSADIYLSGAVEVRMEYYDHLANAVARLRWEKNPPAAPPPAPTPTPNPGGGAGSPTVIYVVRYGDTLASIARQFGTTVEAIMAANGLTSYNIYPGQRLVIPVSAPPVNNIPGEVIVDDGGPGFVTGGSPTSWRVEPVGHGGRMTWTRNNTTRQPNYNWARWYPRLAASRYEVYVHIPSQNATTRAAIYWIAHRDGFTARLVDQLAYSNTWVSLGIYRFTGTSGDYVSLNDITGEPYVSTRLGFDAVKWVPR